MSWVINKRKEDKIWSCNMVEDGEWILDELGQM